MRSSRALVALLSIQVLCFAPYWASTGLYLDDWALLRDMMPAGSLDLAAGWKAFASAYWSRPVSVPYYWAMIAWGGLSPWRYRLAISVLELATGGLFLAWCSRLLKDRELALTATVLALAYPSYSAVHVWFTSATTWGALSLVLIALLLHERRDGGGRPARLLLGQLCYAASLGLYEAFAFFPLALLVSGRKTRREAVRELLPFGVTFAVVMLLQRVIGPALWGPLPRPAAFSLSHGPRVYAAALWCAAGGLLRLGWDSAATGSRVFPGWWWPLLPLGAWATATALEPAPADAPAAPTLRRAAAAGAILFCAAFVPYAVSGAYTPRLAGVMNRVNMGGAFGAALLLAAGLGRLPRTRRGFPARRAATAAVLAAFALCHWATGADWSVAWRQQRDIVRGIDAQLPPGPATVLLRGSPADVGGAPVFQNHFDLAYALALLARREGVAANWIYEAESGPREVRVVNGDGNAYRYPYDRLFVYFAPAGRLFPVNKP